METIKKWLNITRVLTEKEIEQEKNPVIPGPNK